MFEAPLGYAFVAGMAALLNPCGIAMLPAYIGYQLGLDTGALSPPAFMVRGTALGLSATLGFMVIFGAIGAVIAAGGRAVITAMPYAGLGVGIAVTVTALWLIITKRHLGLLVASRIRWDRGRGLTGTLLFGLFYGLCSLSCALPIFLVVVVSSMAVGGFASAFASFLSYGAGMGAMLLLITWAVVVSKEGARRAVRRVVPYVEMVGNFVLLGAGLYVTYYWTLGTGGKQFLFG
jgi:cytochrome c biogenesis protein CcdA